MEVDVHTGIYARGHAISFLNARFIYKGLSRDP